MCILLITSNHRQPTQSLLAANVPDHQRIHITAVSLIAESLWSPLHLRSPLQLNQYLSQLHQLRHWYRSLPSSCLPPGPPYAKVRAPCSLGSGSGSVQLIWKHWTMLLGRRLTQARWGLVTGQWCSTAGDCCHVSIKGVRIWCTFCSSRVRINQVLKLCVRGIFKGIWRQVDL